MLREILQKIALDFGLAKSQPIANHPLASFIRHDARDAVTNLLNNAEYIVTGSPGQAPNWADIPWIGVFNPEITKSATHGYYVVYLFASTMDRVALCLGQGVTKAREEFGRRARHELLRRGDLIRERVPEYKPQFLPGPINLSANTQLAKDYEVAPAFYLQYETAKLPPNLELETDFHKMISLYDLLYQRGGIEHLSGSIELLVDSSEKDPPKTIEEQRQYVRHNRIDRRSNASQKAKDIHGYQCQICGFDYEQIYGELGANYIEAHHLVPLASLPEGVVVSMDPKTDFAVLCANCHRMIHRRKEPLKPDAIRNSAGVKTLREWFRTNK